MQIITDINEMRHFSRDAKKKGKSIAFVPTMGYLHQGHASLLKKARNIGDVLVMSIFVNPAQFGPNEDYAAYPRDMARDTALAEANKADVVFYPAAQEMYPDGFQTYVDVKDLSRHLCGLSRPGHFRGVATVVVKLFSIVKPDIALFGEKDFQQAVIIKRVAQDLNMDVDIITMPTVREADGIAMSSRNSYLNKEEVNIATLEDPVEYYIPGVNQSQVRPEIDYTFASGLRSILRQDPDIIMVGEIRDAETAKLAIQAALTGHLVLSTIHTNDAIGTIPRFIDMGIEPYLIPPVLIASVAQRLVRKLCPSREKYELSRDEQAQLEKSVDAGAVLRALKDEAAVAKDATWKNISFYKAKETPESPSGYTGRVGIYETLSVTPTIKELVMKNATADEVEKQARSEGMLTMSEDGIFKAVQGVTTIEEVLRVITE